jgi:hypothetical protein
VTGTMRMRASRPVKSAGLVVKSGKPSAMAVAAISQVDGPASWLTACGNDGRRHAAEDTRRLGIERHWVELAPDAVRNKALSRANESVVFPAQRLYLHVR